MAKSIDLVLRILGDTKGAEKAAKDAAGGVAGLQAKVGKLTKPAVAVAGAVAAIGISAVNAASDTQQAMGAVQSVFGKSAGQVEKYAKQADQSLGLSASAYANLASIIGAQLKSAGVPIDQAAQKTQELISRGADLAATFGGTTSDAVEALSAALRGEADPAERLGLSLSQTRVNALLAERGQAKLTGTALSAAKAQAVLDLVTKQSAGAIGQFGRETNTAAGSAEIAKAKWQNAKSALGTALLPTVAAVTSALGAMGAMMSDHTTTAQILLGVFAGLSAAILLVAGALKVYNLYQAASTALSEWSATSTVANAVGYYALAAAQWVATAATTALTAAQKLLRLAFLSSPWGWIALAIVAVVAGLILAWKHSDRFRAIVTGVFDAIKGAASAVLTWVKSHWQTILAILIGPFGIVALLVIRNFDKIKAAALAVLGFLRNLFAPIIAVWGASFRLVVAIFQLGFTVISTAARLTAQLIAIPFQILWLLLQAGVRAASALIAAALSALAGPARSIANAISTAFSFAFRLMGTVARAMIAPVRAAFNALSGPARTVANLIRSIFASAFAAARSVATSAMGGIRTAVAGVTSVLRTLGGVARTIGSAISSGLSGVVGLFNNITSAVQRLIGWISKIKIPKIKIPGVGSVGGTAAVATRATGARTAGLAAPRIAGRPRALRAAPTASSGGGIGPIYVTGVLDGADAARKIRALLRDDDRRNRGVIVHGRTVPA